MEEGAWHKVPQLAEELLVFNRCWESQFSLMVLPLVSQPRLRVGPAPKNSWVTQIGLIGLREGEKKVRERKMEGEEEKYHNVGRVGR